MSISLSARQKFRQRIQSIEKADEVLNALDEFVNRFQLITADLQTSNWTTVLTYTPLDNTAVMLTFSIIAKEIETSKHAGFRKTALFHKQNEIVSDVSLQHSDFTDMQERGFATRFISQDGDINLQVKGLSNKLTKWQGSIEIEQHSGE